jgi:hypothetical protein
MQTFGQQGPQAGGGTAHIRFGVYNQHGNFVGKSIQDIRTQYGQLWGIPTDATAFKGKDKMDDNYVVQPGDNLEFHRRAGEKGNR